MDGEREGNESVQSVHLDDDDDDDEKEYESNVEKLRPAMHSEWLTKNFNF